MENSAEKKKVNIVMTGEVSSIKTDKTVTVDVVRIFQHPVYKKIVRKKKKYLAHDSENKCNLGDTIKMKLVRPISKRKKWLVTEIISTKPGKERGEK